RLKPMPGWTGANTPPAKLSGLPFALNTEDVQTLSWAGRCALNGMLEPGAMPPQPTELLTPITKALPGR
ncbi:MAG: hypothetical protein KDJ99_33815, partial [Candidatus Competibacteraceae bacterium]|nr:hypothetical protein [Candidatus Competibacteraceae bacterium]